MAEKIKGWVENWKVFVSTIALAVTCIGIIAQKITANVNIENRVQAIEDEQKVARGERIAISAAVQSLAIETAKVSVLLAELKQDLREMRKERQP